MKKADAMKWVNALRSGKYKQGMYGRLRDNHGGFCCLGVLDDIFPELDLRGENAATLGNFRKIGLASADGNLPSVDEDDIGFNCSATNLARLNDGFGDYKSDERIDRYSFDEIADIIQAEYIECVV